MPRTIFAALLLLCACPSAPASSGASPPVAPNQHLKLMPAPYTLDAAAVVKAELAKSQAAGRRLVVYVGAAWCEPCRHFHEAAEKGQLDADFGDVDLLVFDADLDAERLLLAGYESRYIPLLVVPGPDGRATDKHMEGSSKVDTLADMTPRLKQLLGR